MPARNPVATWAVLALVGLGAAACQTTAPGTSAYAVLAPARMPAIGTVDERYQSYNVEMLEVTGGKFWKPYGPELATVLRQSPPAAGSDDTPAGMNPALYQYRPPIDLSHPRLRQLASALGPAYVRVSGTWANTTYFAEAEPAPSAPPAGFMGVLSQRQWRGVVDFANATNARIVTSFATGAGTRDAAGIWTPDQARRWLAFTRSVGGRIAAAEFMNEPNLAGMGGAPDGYDAQAYGRDFQRFHAFARQEAPDLLILGPGAVGETVAGPGLTYGASDVLSTRDLLAAAGPGMDAFSYHHYGAVSIRCLAQGHQTTVEAALSEPWLARTDETLAFYRGLRNEFLPGRPFWNTETADAACGGNPWASTFLDSFRYLDQLGRLARQEVKVVAHNTLVASDYGLLDENTFEPKPNYWAAWLWRQLMGSTVLDSRIPIQPGLHVYAHCLRDRPGGVALLVINNDRLAPRVLGLPSQAYRFTLAAIGPLQTRRVALNGAELKLGNNDALPIIPGVELPAGAASFAPATITFVALPRAANPACAAGA